MFSRCNPKKIFSGIKRKSKQWQFKTRLDQYKKNELEKLHLSYTLLNSKYHGHIKIVLSQNLIDLFEQHNLPKHIIVVGGDGTINETINGIKIAQKKYPAIPDIPVGIIPTGYKNEFITSAQMEINKDNAIKKIVNCKDNHFVKIGYIRDTKKITTTFFY